MSNNRLNCVFDNQQTFKYKLRQTNAAQRIEKLRKLKSVIQANEPQIYKALLKDLRKSEFEAAVTEVLITYSEIDFAIKHLSSWMEAKKAGKTLSNPFAKNRIYYEPKGVCLILSPWNYPFQLTMTPLVSAIAAGNCVVVKPSEISEQTAKICQKIILNCFEEEEIACILGNVETSTALLKLPFDHIFFTGSTSVGKIVMAAGAKNLTSVTLELGGKSPCIIDKDTDLAKAAQKVAWGKLVNSGQTCIAPDYVLIHKDNLDEFVSLYKAQATKMYFKTEDQLNLHTYGKIITEKHYNRLNYLIEDAVDNGGRVIWGGKNDQKNQTIYPTLLTNVGENAEVMKEEIFGPILPLITYETLEEAIAFVNKRNKPLALYIFSRKQKNVQKVIKSTSAGGTCVNDVLIHLANPKVPFGGTNHSGMGSSHGVFGFKNFSHERTVVSQSRIDFNSFIYPPYEGKNWVLKILSKVM